MRVSLNSDGNLFIHLPYGHYLNEVAKALPKRRWHPAAKVWCIPPVITIMSTVRDYMPGVVWDQDAEDLFQVALKKDNERDDLANGRVEFDLGVFDNVPFRLPPRESQKKALFLGRDKEVFAYLMDQGTGKTKVILDDAAHNYRKGRINCLIVLAPNSVKTNWVNPGEDVTDPDTWDEVTKHMAPDIDVVKAAWFATPSGPAKDKLKRFTESLNSDRLLVFAINIDGISSIRSQKFLHELVKRRRCMIAIDESTRIGNHASVRSKVAREIRKACPIARIASGTPVIKSPLKAYGQFMFLDPNILGIATFTEFKARYSVPNPKNPQHIVGYKNTAELAKKIAGCSFRVLKKECLDLEDKVYEKRRIPMTDDQQVLYNNMRDKMIVAFTDMGIRREVKVKNVMTQMGRLQQITSGYLPIIDEETNEQIGEKKICAGTPPKVEEAIQIIEECDHKVIVWARYRFDIKEMAEACKKAGISYVTFFGDTKESDRVLARQRFLADPELKVFIGQISTGGVGLNLYTANTCIYLSNSFSTEDRLQSEDRAHRHGNVGGCMYVDLLCPKTIDEKIIKVLRSNKELADAIMGDGIQSWI